MKIILVLCGLMLVGCQSDEEMRNLIPPGEVRIFTDSVGHTYVVEQHIGDTYTIHVAK